MTRVTTKISKAFNIIDSKGYDIECKNSGAMTVCINEAEYDALLEEHPGLQDLEWLPLLDDEGYVVLDLRA